MLLSYCHQFSESSDVCHSFLRRGLYFRVVGEPLRDRRGGPQQRSPLRDELLSHLSRHRRHSHHHTRLVISSPCLVYFYNISILSRTETRQYTMQCNALISCVGTIMFCVLFIREFQTP